MQEQSASLSRPVQPLAPKAASCTSASRTLTSIWTPSSPPSSSPPSSLLTDPRFAVDVSESSDESNSHSDDSNSHSDESSDHSLEYVSASERDDDDDDETDDSELEALRSELEAPSIPPLHNHHLLCRCPDKPQNLSSLISSASASASGSVSPISPMRTRRSLRPDPYSRWNLLERNIILFIQQHQDECEAGVDIYSIGEAVKIAHPLQANPDTVDAALNRLLDEHVIKETINDTHFKLAHYEHTYPVL